MMLATGRLGSSLSFLNIRAVESRPQLSFLLNCSATFCFAKSGGERGIRTLGRGLRPYTRLAGERLQPARPSLRLGKSPHNLAEGVGFEPTELSLSGFQDRLLKPLGHPSAEQGMYHLLPGVSTAWPGLDPWFVPEPGHGAGLSFVAESGIFGRAR